MYSRILGVVIPHLSKARSGSLQHVIVWSPAGFCYPLATRHGRATRGVAPAHQGKGRMNFLCRELGRARLESVANPRVYGNHLLIAALSKPHTWTYHEGAKTRAFVRSYRRSRNWEGVERAPLAIPTYPSYAGSVDSFHAWHPASR